MTPRASLWNTTKALSGVFCVRTIWGGEMRSASWTLTRWDFTPVYRGYSHWIFQNHDFTDW